MTGTVPPVPQIPAGWGPLPADFTAWVTTPFTFLSSKVMFRAQLQAAEALSGWTLAQLDTVLEDPYGGWNGSTYAWTCPPGCSGWYEITMAGLTNPQSGTSEVWTALYLDGNAYQVASGTLGDTGNTSGSSGMIPVPLLGGADYVQMYIYSATSVTAPATAGRYPYMEIAWISA